MGDPKAIRCIAFITSMADTLGNFRGPLIADLVALGVRVLALAPDHDDRTRAAVRAFGGEPIDISLDRTGIHPLRDAADTARLAAQLRRLGPDAVLSYFIKPVIYGSLAARMAGVPNRFAMVEGLGWVFTPGGTPANLKRRALRRAVSLLYRAGFAACRKVFMLNQDDIDEFVGAGLLPAAKVVRLTGVGVDLGQLAPAPPVERLPTFLLMARLLREKGIPEYAAAARIVKASHPEARFVLLGRTDSNPGGLSDSEVRGWVDEGLLEWPGHVEDVRPWIAETSVYVLPSWREGVPRSTQEAMAMARAVITTDAPGCRETVEEGVNGFLVPVRDPPALAQAMLRFIEQPELIAAMGSASRTLAEQRFDARAINRRILAEMGIS
jgi:glycosyltransferase involved in cell wall biosynthesis